MNTGQYMGILKLRVWQLEDELAGSGRVVTSIATTFVSAPGRRPRSMRDGLPKRVIDLLDASARPLSSSEIAAALDCDLMPLYQRLPWLLRDGRIKRQGRRRHYLYYSPGRRA